MIKPLAWVKFILKYHVRLIGILLLAAFISFSLPASSALPYGFGSKVNINDLDIGNPLHKLCADLKYRDVGNEIGKYDLADPVYIDTDADGYLEINDIRLTPLSIFAPGSKVRKTDFDIKASLLPLDNWSIAFSDLDGNEIYDLGDALYLHNMSMGSKTVLGDIRLTTSWDYPAGSKVKESDKDAGEMVVSIRKIMDGKEPENIAYFCFYNINGNYNTSEQEIKKIYRRNDSATPIYDSPDQVYIDIISTSGNQSYPTIGFVDANDLRLSI